MNDQDRESDGLVSFGQRLEAARKARRLSQSEVAQQIGVSRPTYAEMEKGSREAKPAEKIALARLFGYTVHELVRSGTPLAEFVPQFRMPSHVTLAAAAQEQAAAEFRKLCEDYLALESRSNSPFLPRYIEPYAMRGVSVRSAAEDIAIMERQRLNLGDGPLTNLWDVLETQVGLRVFVYPLSSAGQVAGMFFFTAELGGCILINGVHPPTRRLYSLAHEYAHFLHDRYSAEITMLVEQERRPRSEQFADYFASGFLMPAFGLRQRFRAIVQKRGDFTVSDSCYLADQYGVSVEALTRRLEDLDLVRKGTWLRLVGKGFEGSKGQRELGIAPRQEPAVRLPERYRRLAVQAFEEGEISESELMRYLRCSRIEAREIVAIMMQPVDVDMQGTLRQLNLDFAEILELTTAERE